MTLTHRTSIPKFERTISAQYCTVAPGFSAPRILIVANKEKDTRTLMRALAHAGYAGTRVTSDSSTLPSTCAEFRPDVVLIDLDMPFSRGYGLIEELSFLLAATGVPLLAMTADSRARSRVKVLSLGARDLISKPFYLAELLIRVRNLLETRSLYVQHQREQHRLGGNDAGHACQSEAIEIAMLERLALSAEHRGDETESHTERVGRTAARLARKIGLPSREVTLIERAAALHDIGKIGIPDGILLKPGRLTSDEFGVVKNHTVIGADILSGGSFPLLEMARQIALSHHERWDGDGYPRGLRGQKIPLSGRIVALADAYDVITHRRPYKQARSASEAIDEIAREHGRQFDPQLVVSFHEICNGECEASIEWRTRPI